MIRKPVFLAALAATLVLPLAARADDDHGHGHGHGNTHGHHKHKEKYWDGNCEVERKWKHGEYEEKRKCRAPERVVVVPAPAPKPVVLVYPPWIVRQQNEYVYEPRHQPQREAVPRREREAVHFVREKRVAREGVADREAALVCLLLPTFDAPVESGEDGLDCAVEDSGLLEQLGDPDAAPPRSADRFEEPRLADDMGLDVPPTVTGPPHLGALTGSAARRVPEAGSDLKAPLSGTDRRSAPARAPAAVAHRDRVRASDRARGGQAIRLCALYPQRRECHLPFRDG